MELAVRNKNRKKQRKQVSFISWLCGYENGGHLEHKRPSNILFANFVARTKMLIIYCFHTLWLFVLGIRWELAWVGKNPTSIQEFEALSKAHEATWLKTEQAEPLFISWSALGIMENQELLGLFQYLLVTTQRQLISCSTGVNCRGRRSTWKQRRCWQEFGMAFKTCYVHASLLALLASGLLLCCWFKILKCFFIDLVEPCSLLFQFVGFDH